MDAGVSTLGAIARDDGDLTKEVRALRVELDATRRALLGLQTFEFRGETYDYLVSDSNRTWDNERAVELPIAARAVREAEGSVLEVGNVLRHYFKTMRHRVVDKYEQTAWVDNIDVLDVTGSYELILSISTLEHVGHSEGQAEEKAVEAIRHLQRCLAPGGRLLFTVPVGYNFALDEAIGRGIEGVETSFLRRIDRANRWEEAPSWRSVRSLTYGRLFPAANALVVGEARAERALEAEDDE